MIGSPSARRLATRVGFGVALVLLALAATMPLSDTATAAAIAPSIAASNEDSVAVLADGSLWTWGADRYGSLGLGDVLPRSVPVQVGAGTTWSQTAAGGWYVMALKQDGSLWTWGSNELGQLGQGNQTSQLTPVVVPVAGGHHWLAVACGFEHTLAIRDDHTLWAWGSNHSGELGVGDTTTRLSPTQVGADATWSSIACGSYYSLAIKADGSLWAWGDNARGELGLGAAGGVHNAPVRVGVANDWLAVSGSKHDLTPFTLALKTDHSLWAWGDNDEGELGVGTLVEHDAPVQVSPGSQWSTVSAGSYCALGIKQDGSLWGWGLNNGDQLGATPTNPRTAPFQIGVSTNWATVSAGYIHSLATKNDGSIWAWGSNWYGQLAIGYPNLRCSPYQVGMMNGWAQVSSSSDHTAAVRTDHTLWAWGGGALGQLGSGTGQDSTTPIQVGGAADWARVACGNGFSFAVKQNGTLWAWGVNDHGQLGLGDTTGRDAPMQVGTRTDWASVVCADGMGGAHVLATTTGGQLWAWGANSQGQLGLGDTVQRTTPTRVGADSDWAAVACGANHSAAVKTGGTLWMWGSNGAGQLGLGDTVQRNSPARVGLLSDHWLSVACGVDLNEDPAGGAGSGPGMGGSTLAVKADHTLWAWGSGNFAQLGLGAYASHDLPTQVGALNTWADVAACSYMGTSIARRLDGTLWASGDGLWGTLGIGLYGPVQTFTQIGSATGWLSTEGGGRDGFAIAGDGTLWAWGFNLGGDLGLGDPLTYPDPVQLVFSGAADVTPPVFASLARSVDTRSGGWSKRPISLKFSATDAGSGVARVQYSLNGGIGWLAGAKVVSAAVTVSRSGVTSVMYQAIDRRGNASAVRLINVKIDRLRPKPYASTVIAKRGKWALLKYRVADVSPLTVRLVVKNSRDVVVKHFTIKGASPVAQLITSFRCKLAKGTYRWYVYAADSVGYRQIKPAVGKLVVK